MRALVTGSEGFVGRHFCSHLAAWGWSVTHVDIAEPYWLDARSFFDEVTIGFDLVVHCAAVVGGRKVIEHSPLDQAVDLELDAALFRWARATNQACLVYFSSSAAYPTHLQSEDRWRPIALEEDDLDPADSEPPDALYGRIKVMGEYLAGLYRAEGGRVIVCRPFSGYGADQGDCYPFPAMVGRALRREDPFEIWGTGRQVRDFVHVDDIVGAVMAAYHQGIDGPFNIGTGIATSMLDLAEMVCARAGYSPRFQPLADDDHPQGVSYRVADTHFLETFYRPAVTLSEGIERALAAVGTAS